MDIGVRIRQARIRQGLKQTEVGPAVGVTSQAVSQWESGATRRLYAEHLLGLSRTLKVSADWLLTGKDNAGAAAGPTKNAELPPQDVRLLTLFHGLTSRERIALLTVLQINRDTPSPLAQPIRQQRRVKKPRRHSTGSGSKSSG